MADVAEATTAAKVALLKQIEKQAPLLTSGEGLRDLAAAYAMTVGAMTGRLPGTLVSS